MDNYCTKCGSQLINGVCPVCSQNETQYNQQMYYQQPQYQQNTDYQQMYYQQPQYQQNTDYQQMYYQQPQYQQTYNNQSSICPTCGTQLINGICPKCTNRQMTANQYKNDARFTRLFMSPNEKLITTLGNTYLQNYLSTGLMSKGFSVISDKRAYFYGTSYNISYNKKGNAKAIKTNRSQMIDLKDITGTGFKNTSNVGYAVASILFPIIIVLIFMVMSSLGSFKFESHSYSSNYSYEESNNSNNSNGSIIIWVIILLAVWIFLIYRYYASRLSLISIQYAGGEIAFDIRWFSQKEINSFQKQLRLAKDKAIEASENAVADRFSNAISGLYTSQNQTVQTSKADELVKYAELLQKGMITQEEYDNIKRSLL